MYADLTADQKSAIIDSFRDALRRGATDARHAAVCAAHDVLEMPRRAWDGKKGSNAYAAALTVLVQEGIVRIEAVDNRFQLSERLQGLIHQGVKTFGTYDPKEVVPLFEEELTLDELEAAQGFLGWVHENGKQFGWGNIDKVWREYQRSGGGK